MAERVQMATGITGSEAPVEETQSPERPEWLPEKFGSPEDMAKAYGELESKMGEQSSGEAEVSESEPKEVEATEPGTLSVESLEEFSQEFYENGDLSQESFDRLQSDLGIPEDIARAYVEGQKAVVEQARQSIFAEVGGQETYEAMLEWAKDNLSEDDIAAYDSAIAAGDVNTAKMVAKGLHAQFTGANPKLSSGKASPAAGTTGYASWQQVSADMKKPEYQRDPAFRQRVQDRLSVSNLKQ